MDGDAYFGFPFALGGSKMRNYTTVTVGETRNHVVNNLFSGYEFETVQLLGAEREGASGDNRLPVERLDDSYTRAALGDSAIVALHPIGPDELVVTANLQENAVPTVEMGDELEVVYDAKLSRTNATNPAWVDLLREAEQAILRGNLISAVPLLVSAVDGGLYRLIYLYFVLNGRDRKDAKQHIKSRFDDGHGNIYTKDLAKDALNEITGSSLTDAHGPYGERWHEFYGEHGNRGFRDAVIHPDNEPLDGIDRETVIEWFNISVSLIIGGFELLWELDSDG
ncbi:hypothetical protein [Halopiger xanaduensis]|uniref:hypothetical protein n=1 Tax=Halopiger xanaduensis TaxID=387343 RepID=UPI0011D23EAE|nr:hypothetical protein [Halopiger xanaduensis]